MGEPGVTVRSGARRDIAAVADVMARAFEEDPPFVWMLPEAAERRRRLRTLFVTMVRWEVLPRGGVEVACDAAGRVVGAALWLPPGRWRMGFVQQMLTLPGSLRAFGNRIGYGAAFVNAAARVHPVDPHWYLHGIGVDPTSQGRCVGGALLRSRLDRCDTAGQSAYLEASKPENAVLYERFGFTVSGRLALPAGAPEVIPMWRRPHRHTDAAAARAEQARADDPPAGDDTASPGVVLEPPRIAGAIRPTGRASDEQR